RQKDLARFVQLAVEFDDGVRTTADFVADIGARFGTEGEGRGVNLLTYHRAKGLEFEAVFLPRVEEGELPFKRSRSDEAITEERRLFYVGITRAKSHLAISWVHDGRRKGSTFIGELMDAKRPAGAGASAASLPVVETLAAAVGLEVGISGGFSGEIVELESDGVTVALDGGGQLFVDYGERVTSGGKTLPLGPPSTDAADKDLLIALKDWRKQRAKDDEVPAYVIFHDSTLQEIAAQKPADLDDLAVISGVGPTKLERYGNDILRIIEKLAS
ncbi:MAG TPA: 3'-5' exonuclease, partial [Actinomycetota bacterium]|nr:3'-5' exonuclease [Actinomycetota bacterium]